MKRRRATRIFFALALCVAGCGSSGVGQQDAVQKTGTVQEGRAQSASTDKMQEAPNAQVMGAEPVQGAEGKAVSYSKDGDGSKYQADFLGIDSSKIKSCTVYHDLSKEELDMSTAKGKYFIQMLSGFFDSPKYRYSALADVYEMWQLEGMEGWVTKSYYVLLEMEEPSEIKLNRTGYSGSGDTSIETISSNILLIGVDPEFGDILLRSARGSEYMTTMECSGVPEGTAEFEEKYEAWKNIEDWDAAFAEAEAEKASQERGLMGSEGVKGIDASQMQLCRVYHNGGQEDIDLTGERGAAFIQMLSGFLEEQAYSQGFPFSDLDDEGVAADVEQVADFVKERGDNYYILFQTDQDCENSFQNTEKGITTVHNYDMLLVEVDVKEKTLVLSIHEKDNHKRTGFISVLGIRKGEAVKEFVRRYGEWEASE